MSGGRFDYYNEHVGYSMDGKWEDHELNALFRDLFVKLDGGSCRDGDGGLAQSLDFYLSCDTSEEDYRADVELFKRRWLHRTTEDRVEFYQDALREYAEKLIREMSA